MILTLTLDGAIMATIESRDGRTRVVNAVRDFGPRLYEIVKLGIQYPKDSPLAPYNTEAADGRKLLHSIAGLYERVLGTHFSMILGDDL